MALTSALLTLTGCPDSPGPQPVGTNPPVAYAGPDQVVRVGDRVQLHGTASDPDGDLTRIEWSWSGSPDPAIILHDAASLDPWFLPQLPGQYQLLLSAFDSRGAGYHDNDLVTITVLPITDCSAVTLASGQTIRASIAAGETDSFTFCAEAGSTVTIEVKSVEGSDMFVPRLVLLSPAGETLANVKAVPAGELGRATWVATVPDLPVSASGVFTILCSAGIFQTGFYDITLTVTQ